jgi:hypothetical protein
MGCRLYLCSPAKKSKQQFFTRVSKRLKALGLSFFSGVKVFRIGKINLVGKLEGVTFALPIEKQAVRLASSAVKKSSSV